MTNWEKECARAGVNSFPYGKRAFILSKAFGIWEKIYWLRARQAPQQTLKK